MEVILTTYVRPGMILQVLNIGTNLAAALIGVLGPGLERLAIITTTTTDPNHLLKTYVSHEKNPRILSIKHWFFNKNPYNDV